MKKANMKIITLFLLVAFASTAFAQEGEAPKKDNTGTNPINFTYDYRLYYEMQQFKDDGGSQNRAIMEFRAPLGRDLSNVLGKEESAAMYNWGNRMRTRHQKLGCGSRIRSLLQHLFN